MSVRLTIDRCEQCPYRKLGDHYSTDGWDIGRDWHCTKANRRIFGFVERTTESRLADIPAWCPLRPRRRHG